MLKSSQKRAQIRGNSAAKRQLEPMTSQPSHPGQFENTLEFRFLSTFSGHPQTVFPAKAGPSAAQKWNIWKLTSGDQSASRQRGCPTAAGWT